VVGRGCGGNRGGDCGMDWCGRERRRRLGLGFWLCGGERESDEVACFDW